MQIFHVLKDDEHFYAKNIRFSTSVQIVNEQLSTHYVTTYVWLRQYLISHICRLAVADISNGVSSDF